MTDDPENLRKFLESDDPAMVLMGLSMAKGTKVRGRATQRSTYLRDAVARALEKIGHEVE